MRLFPVIALLALTTVFPEFIVGRPLLSFLDPGTFLFLFLGYGLVILVLRELAVRYSIGLRGLFIWGIAYGIINEGLLAKTMITSQNLPVNMYDSYGVFLGISWPWSLAISLWHSMAAVTFPKLLVHAVFPKRSKEQWLGTNTTYILGTILLLLVSFAFIGNAEQPLRGTSLQLVIFLVIMAALFIAGRLFKGELNAASAASRINPLLFGLSVIIPFWVLAFIAAAKLPVILFFIAAVAVVFLYAYVLQKNGWNSLPSFLFFGIGWYLHNALQAFFIILAQQNPFLALFTMVLQGTALALLFWKARQYYE